VRGRLENAEVSVINIDMGGDMKPKGIVVVNSIFLVVLILYWAAAVAFFPLVDWYKSIPLALGTLAPAVIVVATFWSIKTADGYSRRNRPSEEIDSRTHVNRWLTAPVLVVSSLPIIELENAMHIGHPWDNAFIVVFALAFTYAWWRIICNATIGDFTFERES
jgi:preprotein translocase subunit SecY